MSATKKEYKRVTVKSLVEMKTLGEKISMLTAYDYTMAKIVDGAGVDVILVGDSASNVMAEVAKGLNSRIPAPHRYRVSWCGPVPPTFQRVFGFLSS